VRERVLFTANSEEQGSRLDGLLRSRMPELPARSVRFAIDAGEVFVNGRPERKGRILVEGDRVEVRTIAEPEDWLPEAGELPGGSVLYEDAAVAVLCKPPNVHTEPHRPHERGTLAGFLLRRYPFVTGFSSPPGLTLLTRLDYATSGAVPAALTAQAFEFLTREREQGRIRKTYCCLVAGRMRESMVLSFRIETEGGERVRVRPGTREPDPTRWTIATPLREVGDGTLVRAEISRGKRHQIRAHLAAAGFPVIGDRRYSAVPPAGPGKSRLMLHAAEVAFLRPDTKEWVRVAAPLPEEFGVT
jgi:23S rRNA pseudouridine1911/1915/1917 synthase